MKAWMVTAAKAPLEQRELETPVPQGTEVLVETAYCGVCHSDLHFWKGEYNMGGGKIMKLADRGVKLPQAPGHEIAGRVVAKGPDATGVEVGDMRVVYPWLGCGDCYYCNNGLDNWCRTPKGIGVVRSGGFGSHVMVPHARYLADPGKVDPALAATYACSGLTIYSSLKKIMPLDPDRPILLIGAGGLGLMAIEMLKALDHHQIISVDIDADKRRVAEERGATVTFDGRADDLVDQIAAYCGKVPAVLDFVNNDKTAAAGLACLDKGGTLVLVGVAGGRAGDIAGNDDLHGLADRGQPHRHAGRSARSARTRQFRQTGSDPDRMPPYRRSQRGDDRPQGRQGHRPRGSRMVMTGH
ncbi:alcohol dehydrogenase catalytic domain-containing protein [Novosphingobium colocasiae]